jgi:hypothetical protein
MPKLNSFTKFIILVASTIVIVNAQAKLTPASKLALDGIGPIRTGMTVGEASRAAGVRLIKILSAGRTEEYCAYFEAQGGPKGINFMVREDRIVRVDISNEQVTTIRGIKIGDPEEKILRLYPPAQIQVVTGLIGGRMKRFTFVPRDAADRNYRLIFDTGRNRVERFRSGKIPDVEQIEGCF